MYNNPELSHFEYEAIPQVLRLSWHISFLRLFEHNERRYHANCGYKLLQGYENEVHITTSDITNPLAPGPCSPSPAAYSDRQPVALRLHPPNLVASTTLQA